MSVDSIQQAAIKQVQQPSQTSAQEDNSDSVWGEDGFTFADLLDIINPLQHIPVVSTIYQKITGDELGDAPRVIGGALFGGVSGLVSSSVDTIVRRESGSTISEHFMNSFDEEPGTPDAPVVNQAQSVAGADTTSFEEDEDWAAFFDEDPQPFNRQVTDDNLFAGVIRMMMQTPDLPGSIKKQNVEQAVSIYQASDDKKQEAVPILKDVTG
ncbi:MAG: hypothetical protein HOM11_00675 [Methylococcales bacterium]|jgi:hypothetical protein|nr:hypothetical protein [Methylococcales bacterium]